MASARQSEIAADAMQQIALLKKLKVFMTVDEVRDFVRASGSGSSAAPNIMRGEELWKIDSSGTPARRRDDAARNHGATLWFATRSFRTEGKPEPRHVVIKKANHGFSAQLANESLIYSRIEQARHSSSTAGTAEQSGNDPWRHFARFYGRIRVGGSESIVLERIGDVDVKEFPQTLYEWWSEQCVAYKIGFESESLEALRKYVADVLLATVTLGSLGIVHRDLAADNVVIRSAEKFEIVVMDFGLATTRMPPREFLDVRPYRVKPGAGGGLLMPGYSSERGPQTVDEGILADKLHFAASLLSVTNARFARSVHFADTQDVQNAPVDARVQAVADVILPGLGLSHYNDFVSSLCVPEQWTRVPIIMPSVASG